MQPYLAPAGSPMTSGIAIHAGTVAADLTEIEAKLSRTLDRPAPSRHAAVPKKTLRERLRRPLLIAFPVILVAVGTAYHLAEEPYVSTDDAFVRAAKELVNARVAGQVTKIAVIDNQRVQRGQLLFQIDRSRTRLPSIRPTLGLPARDSRSISSRPPIASNWPSCKRQTRPRTLTSVSMRDGKRSSLTVGRRARSLTVPTRI